MAKAVKKHTEDTISSLFHCGLIKIILTHELQKKILTWQQFVVHHGFEEPKEQLDEGLKEDEVLMLTHIGDHIEDSEATRSKKPLRRIRTISMVK